MLRLVPRTVHSGVGVEERSERLCIESISELALKNQGRPVIFANAA